MNKRELKNLDLSNTYSGKYWQQLKMASYRLIKFQGRAVAAAFFFSGLMFVGAPEQVMAANEVNENAGPTQFWGDPATATITNENQSGDNNTITANAEAGWLGSNNP